MLCMHTFPRRTFLEGAAGLLPFAALSGKAATGSHHLKNIGVQLYTVRSILPKDPAATLNTIQEIGYTEVEAIYGGIDEMWPSLEKTKLKAVSVHLGTDLFSDDSKMSKTLEDVKKRGFQYAVFPYLPVPQRNGLEGMHRLAGLLNKAGEKSHKLGIRMCYHNHAFEYEPIDGTMPLAVLMKETDKNLVSLELDVFWASRGGHDPVEIIKTYSGRIALVHLKDKAKDLPVAYNENVPHDAFKEVGRGSLDFPAILRAATAEGVKHFFVEQDFTPGNPLDSLRISYNYLHTLAF